jgi:polar amino acid transport system ATP-binding protein
VDLNRNFCDWAADAPKNYMYRASHDLLVSKPGLWKLVKLLWFRYRHGDDGIWTAISRGQYEYPDGLFYGGDQIQPEYRIVQKIYDDVMADEGAKSLLSVGLHTGLGDYKIPAILVSHPTGHANVEKFTEIFAPDIEITPDEKGAVNAAELSGDLVDWLEARYANRHIPILTADLEIGTGTSWISPVLKRMDQGDAVWDVVHRGAVSAKTKHHLSESWAPRDKKWRQCSLWVADVFAEKLHKYMEKNL